MLKRELFILSFATALAFLLVAVSGMYLVEKLHYTSEMLAKDTLPGLVDAGLAEEYVFQNRSLLRDILLPNEAAERPDMLGLVSVNHTDDLWQDYAKNIYNPEDYQNFQAMMLARSNYLASLPPLFALIKNNQIPEAALYFSGDSRAAFMAYQASVSNLFKYNVNEGRQRAAVIVQSMNYVKWILVAFCIMVFGLGLILGIRLGLVSNYPNRPQTYTNKHI